MKKRGLCTHTHALYAPGHIHLKSWHCITVSVIPIHFKTLKLETIWTLTSRYTSVNGAFSKCQLQANSLLLIKVQPAALLIFDSNKVVLISKL